MPWRTALNLLIKLLLVVPLRTSHHNEPDAMQQPPLLAAHRVPGPAALIGHGGLMDHLSQASPLPRSLRDHYFPVLCSMLIVTGLVAEQCELRSGLRH